MSGVLSQFISRLVSGVTKLINTIIGDAFTLFRFVIILAIIFFAGRLASPKGVAVEKEAKSIDVLEEFLKKVAVSGSTLDTVNLILLQEAFGLVNNFVTIIETADILDKEKYFPKPAIEKFKTLVADVQMKIDELKKRFNVNESDRDRMKEIINGIVLDYCQNVTGGAPRRVSHEEHEDIRKATEREFEELFEEGEEKRLDSEEFLKHIADIVESHGI